MRSGSKRRRALFVLSMDTEEEFDWAGEFPQVDCSITNTRHIPEFQTFCESLGIRPTYLVDYPVAANAEVAGMMRQLAQSGRAEIGAHLHPWCTPPIVGPNTERESHVVNLPLDLVARKLQVLTDTIRQNIGVAPLVFRTGRWGVNGGVLRILAAAGYRVDSSIYPYYANEYFSCLDSRDDPYWPDWDNSDEAGAQRDVFELPVTAGFNRKGFRFWGRVHQRLSSPAVAPFRPVGIAWRTGLLKKLYLSPELASAGEMIDLCRAALASDCRMLHMFLHSSTLLPGKSAYSNTAYTRDGLYRSIRQVVDALAERVELEFCTISEAAGRLKNNVAGPS